jgi:outer membrane protein TolC
MKLILTAVILVSAIVTTYGQASTLSMDDFLLQVRRHHPVVKQTAIGVQLAKAGVIKARGAFDPEVSIDMQDKQFEGTSYYARNKLELTVPVWFGVDVKAGRENIRGERVNPEQTAGTLSYIGVTVDPFQTLLLDKRRAVLQQAKLFREQSVAVQSAVINNLIMEAVETYIRWWQSQAELTLVQKALRNAKQRLELVKTMYRVGERPAVDTLEASTQVQSMEQYELEQQAKVFKARLAVSLFLWNEKETILMLREEVLPVAMADESIQLDTVIQQVSSHPDLAALDLDVDALRIDRKLTLGELMPDVQLKYNQLSRESSGLFNGSLLQNNNRFGVGVSVPLRFSEGRGAYLSARYKVTQAELKRMNRQAEIEIRVRQEFLGWQQVSAQVTKQASLAESYQALLRSEELKFANGESSLFLLNSRQLKTVEAQQKLVQLNADALLASARVKWAGGILR